nr:unnamed protein product [Digitaria exilis]
MASGSKKTASSHTTEVVTGAHSFKISGTFTIGSYDWAICFYPDGVSEATKECAAVYLLLVRKNAELRASSSLIVKESWVETTRDMDTKVPPSDLLEQLGKLLLAEEGSDVAFSVGGENFPAHKIVLATRSHVFEAQLYGQMKESMAC